MADQYKVILVEQNGAEYILKANEKVENLSIVCREACIDNVVKIWKPVKFAEGCLLDLGGVRTEIELKSTKNIYNFKLLTATGAENQKLFIDENISMWSGINFYLTEDNAQIHIGKDCMFSKDIEMWASDGHAIISKTEQKVINKCNDVLRIGDHVWIGSNVTLTKGSGIGNDSVIGTGSIVTKKFNENNIVIAGNPAVKIREGITWDRSRPLQFEKKLEQNEIQKKKIVAIIPARFQSSRFPGKPLAEINKKSMIQWVYEKVMAVDEINEVYVATDDRKIYDAVSSFGGKAIMTEECECGTDRVYQASKEIECDIILNIQGDEPMIKVEMIRDLIHAFDDKNISMATLKKKINEQEEIENPNTVKVITNMNNDAIYFSRCTLPYNRDEIDEIEYYKHIGVYGYTKSGLQKFVSLPSSQLEKLEKLEQLRAIENGIPIRVVETKYQSIGVDLPEHIALIEAEMKKEGLA